MEQNQEGGERGIGFINPFKNVKWVDYKGCKRYNQGENITIL